MTNTKKSTLMTRYILCYLTALLCVLAMGCKPTTPDSTPVAESATAATKKINPMPKIDPNLSLAYCMGKFDQKVDDRFELITEPYATRDGMYLRKEAYAAYKQMYRAAKAAGIELVIRSATRNFDYQRRIWENKWTGKTILSDGVNAAKDIPSDKSRAYKILDYSAMPGASRHHWGTDIDINSFSNAYFEYGKGLKVYEWLSAHGHEYGYCQPYTPKSTGRPGYNEEKWHWSYTPLSTGMTHYVSEHLTDDHFDGFMGHETAKDIGVVQKYVLGIADECK